MKIRRFARQFQHSLIALILMGACSGRALAQDHTHAPAAQPLTQAQSSQAATLLQTVRDATARFKDVAAVQAEGYTLTFGCVSGPDSGAMGLHFVNFDLVASGVLDATRPQIVIYEANADGKLQLIGADFLVLADQWNATHKGAPPELMGQLFHLFDTPNRFGLPAFYALHVWA